MGLGNTAANAVWLGSVPSVASPPTFDSARSVKEQWIVEKYVQRRYLSLSCYAALPTLLAGMTEFLTSGLFAFVHCTKVCCFRS